MTIEEMIAEWRKGCSCSIVTNTDGESLPQAAHPEACSECTLNLIAAIEKVLKAA